MAFLFVSSAALAEKPATEFKTAAGKLSCAPALCRAIPVPKGAGGGDVLRYAIRLAAQRQEKILACDPGLSGDPECEVEGKRISGEQFSVPGDGCLYVAQTANSYFPVKKKYCINAQNRLEKVLQPLYFVGVKAVAHRDIPLLQSREEKRTVATIKKGERYEVLVAEVDEFDDFVTAAKWYLVKDSRGIVGWAPQDLLLAKPQCAGKKDEGICFNGD